MKNQAVIIALIAVLFVLVAGSILASFTFYKEYKDKIESLEQQGQAGKAKMSDLESRIDSFKTILDDVSSQVKNYSDGLKSVENTMNLSEEERKNLLAKVEEMKKELQGWQKDYSSAVIDIKQVMLTMKDDLDKMQNKTRDVELGKITVKQEEKKSSSTEPEKKKAATLNFKAGNVRKAGTLD